MPAIGRTACLHWRFGAMSPDLFGPESDEVTISKKDDKEDESKAKPEEKSDESESDKKKDNEEEKQPEYLKIDFEGLADRVIRIPVAAENRSALSALKGKLLFVDQGAPFYGRGSYAEPALKVFDLKDRELSTLAEDIQGYALSHDGSKVLVQEGKGYRLINPDPKSKDEKTVFDRRPDGRSGACRGMGHDLRRGVAAVSRFLLC